MSDKYVIRNCSAIYRSGTCGVKNQIKCQDCTDCVMKQIVEKCKKTKRIFSTESGTNPYAGGRCTEAEGILQLIDVQEVE